MVEMRLITIALLFLNIGPIALWNSYGETKYTAQRIMEMTSMNEYQYISPYEFMLTMAGYGCLVAVRQAD